MRLYLVRHGDTEIGRDGLYPEDGGLTALGRRQATATAERLWSSRVTHILTSALQRARETGAPLAEMTGLTPFEVPGFDEVRIGRLREAPIESINQRIYGTSPRADFSEFGGEAPAEFNQRVLSTLSREIVDRYYELDTALAAFVHGGTISVILDHVEGFEFDGDLRREIPNGSISLMVTKDGRLRLEHGPDSRHLEGVGITHMHGPRDDR